MTGVATPTVVDVVVDLVSVSDIVEVVPDREIYPNAPAVLVAVEARHPDAPELYPGQQSELERLLATTFPLPQPQSTQVISHAPPADPMVTRQVVPRFAIAT